MRRTLLPLVLFPLFAAPRVLAPADPGEVCVAQDPAEGDDEDDEDEPKPGLLGFRERQAERRAALLEKMEGAWVLREFRTQRGAAPTESIRGFALFVDGYLSVTLHGQETYDDYTDFYFQSNISQFELFGDDELRSATLIGHGNFFDGELDVERANEPRSYTVRLAGEHDLTLVRDSGTELTFRRLRTGLFPERAQQLLDERRSGR